MNYILLKRYIDIIISIIFLIIFLPFIILIFFLILLIDQMSPFFLQDRAGYKKKNIKIIKFKTMKNNEVTSLGSILRKYKLYEIPQFINILLGDLSFVGPRPLLLSYNSKYNEFQNLRFNVMPGLTGLSQVKLSKTNKWKNKFTYDVFYSRKISFNFDLYIIYLTILLFIKIIMGKKMIKEDHTPF